MKLDEQTAAIPLIIFPVRTAVVPSHECTANMSAFIGSSHNDKVVAVFDAVSLDRNNELAAELS